MECLNCGAEIKEGMSFCPVCGEEIVFEPVTTEENMYSVKKEKLERKQSTKNYFKKNKKLLGIVGGAMAVIMISVVAFSFFSPIARANRCLKNHDFVGLNEIYIDSSLRYKSEISDAVEVYCTEVLTEYNNDNIDFEEAKERITNAVDVVKSMGDVQKRQTNAMMELHASKEAFQEAEECMAKEEWEQAKQYLGKVIPVDTNFAQIKEKIKECDKRASIAAFRQAQKYQEEEKWQEALEAYKNVTEITPDEYQKAEEQKKVCEEKIEENKNKLSGEALELTKQFGRIEWSDEWNAYLYYLQDTGQSHMLTILKHLMAEKEDKEALAVWNKFVEFMRTVTRKCNCSICVTNPYNEENAVLAVKNGEVLYNFFD